MGEETCIECDVEPIVATHAGARRRTKRRDMREGGLGKMLKGCKVLEMAPAHTLLLIDDDVIIREVLSLLLTDEGWNVTAADGGGEALDILRAGESPALILCDLQMPGLCGPALAAALRAVSPSSFLLAMTATPNATTSQGYDARLIKPFEAREVRRTYDDAVQRPKDDAFQRDSVPFNTPNGGGAGSTEVQSPVLDPTVFGHLQRSMPADRLLALLQLVADDADVRVERMCAALTESNEEVYRAEAHALKGSCRMVGATRLGDLATRAEDLGLGKGLEAQWNPISEFAQSIGEFRHMLKSLSPLPWR